MVQLYVSDSVSRISFADGRVIVWSEELGESQYPIETLDGITLFGRPTMTTPFIVEMLKRERDIQLFTTDGHYQGRISTPDVSYAPRLRLNRPGMSGDSSSWKGWGHVRWFIEEVPAG
ncbi:CRISPR-associated endonuclease Cas1, partial [Mycobacterium tuberculosis]